MSQLIARMSPVCGATMEDSSKLAIKWQTVEAMLLTGSLSTIYLHKMPVSSIVNANNETFSFSMMERVVGFPPGIFKPIWMRDNL